MLAYVIDSRSHRLDSTYGVANTDEIRLQKLVRLYL